MDCKKTIWTLLLCLSNILCGAQDFAHGLFAHYAAYSTTKMPDWSKFAESYNTSTTPTTKIGNFKTLSCYEIGYRFDVNRYYSILSYQHYVGSTTAVLPNKEQRQFTFFDNNIIWGFGFKFFEDDKPFNISAIYNLRIGPKTRIVSEYIYNDGFHSMGSDKTLNGTYLGTGNMGSELGFQMQWKLKKKLGIEIEALKNFNNWVVPSTLSDGSNYKALGYGGGVYNLPQDYVLYTQNPLQYSSDSKSQVNNYFTSFKFMIGLSYTFSSTY
jgi:hypothetical protein